MVSQVASNEHVVPKSPGATPERLPQARKLCIVKAGESLPNAVEPSRITIVLQTKASNKLGFPY